MWWCELRRQRQHFRLQLLPAALVAASVLIAVLAVLACCIVRRRRSRNEAADVAPVRHIASSTASEYGAVLNAANAPALLTNARVGTDYADASVLRPNAVGVNNAGAPALPTNVQRRTDYADASALLPTSASGTDYADASALQANVYSSTRLSAAQPANYDVGNILSNSEQQH